jgi:hypothetical protein
VDVTPPGEEAIRAIREIVMEVEAEWETTLGPRRFGQLKRGLAELVATTSART